MSDPTPDPAVTRAVQDEPEHSASEDVGSAGPAAPEPPDSDGAAGEPSGDRLVEEGEVAADYLEELLDIVDLDGDIDIDVENGRASVAVVAEAGSQRQLQCLVGRDGEVLEALQELTRLAVQAHTGERSRLMLDVGGHRQARRRELVEIARTAVDRARTEGTPVRLEPMSPFERKVVHDAVAETGLASESEGVAPERRVVVLPGPSRAR